ncbi:MAG: GAF domain-containing protein [Bacteroidota bacterium]
MIIAQMPTDEDMRLLDLHSYKLHDASLESEFNELVELAANICNCPISVISLLDKDKQWFRARKGTLVEETPRDQAICGHTILQDNILIIEDTKEDERFYDNPLVCGEMNIRFYAGAPIVSPAGYKLGSLCVIDHKPRKLSSVEKKSLSLIASHITHLLELRVKNKVLHKRANELMELNDKSIISVINDYESVKENIAVELHENMAQIIATNRLYLQMAMQNETNRNHYLQQALDDLGSLLNRMRKVSGNLLPGGLKYFSLEEVLNDMIQNDDEINSFKVGVTFNNKNDNLDPTTNLACIRIIEKWMLVLKSTGNVNNVHIAISMSENISLQIEDDGNGKVFKDVEQHICTSGIYGRVQKLKGDLTYKAGKGRNTLCIQFAQQN